MVNHFEGVPSVCRKSGLVRSLKSYYENCQKAVDCNYSIFDTTPTTFLVNVSSKQDQLKFITRWTEIDCGHCPKEKVPQKHCEQNTWLVKPEASNQGKGIQVCHQLGEIQEFL